MQFCLYSIHTKDRSASAQHLLALQQFNPVSVVIKYNADVFILFAPDIENRVWFKHRKRDLQFYVLFSRL